MFQVGRERFTENQTSIFHVVLHRGLQVPVTFIYGIISDQMEPNDQGKQLMIGKNVKQYGMNFRKV